MPSYNVSEKDKKKVDKFLKKLGCAPIIQPPFMYLDSTATRAN